MDNKKLIIVCSAVAVVLLGVFTIHKMSNNSGNSLRIDISEGIIDSLNNEIKKRDQMIEKRDVFIREMLPQIKNRDTILVDSLVNLSNEDLLKIFREL